MPSVEKGVSRIPDLIPGLDNIDKRKVAQVKKSLLRSYLFT